MKQLPNLNHALQGNNIGKSARAEATTPSEFWEIVLRCWRHKFVFLSLILVFVGTAIFVSFQITPRYTATALLMLDPAEKGPITFEKFVEDVGKTPEDIEGEVKVISSKQLIKKVINNMSIQGMLLKASENSIISQVNPLKLLPISLSEIWTAIRNSFSNNNRTWMTSADRERHIHDRAVGQFANQLSVSAIKDTRMISVSFTAEDPNIAADVVNTLVELYQKHVIDQKYQVTYDASVWLNSQLDELRGAVRQAEETVEQLRQGDVLVQGRNAEIISQRMYDINRQLTETNQTTAILNGKLRQIRTLKEAPEWQRQNASVLNNDFMSALMLEQMRLEQQAADLSSTYGKNHPVMIKLRAETDNIRKRFIQELEKEESSVVEQLAISRERERVLQRELDRLAYKVGDVNESELKLRAAERESEATRRMYETFLGRFKEAEIQKEVQQSNVRLISNADVPSSPSFPNKGAMIVGSFLLALISALGIVQTRYALQRGFQTVRELEHAMNHRVLGVTPRIESKVGRKLEPQDVVWKRPNSLYSESIRNIYSGLKLNSVSNGGSPVIVCSALSDEGKSTIAISIARRAALSGEKCILLDCDFRRPELSRRLNLQSGPGIRDIILGEATLQDSLQEDLRSGMKFLPPGEGILDPIQAVRSAEFHQLIERLLIDYSFVVIDSAPILAVPDGKVLAGLVGEVLFVVRWKKTPRETANIALRQIEEFGGVTSGLVLTQVDRKSRSGYDHGEFSYYSGKLKEYYGEDARLIA